MKNIDELKDYFITKVKNSGGEVNQIDKNTLIIKIKPYDAKEDGTYDGYIASMLAYYLKFRIDFENNTIKPILPNVIIDEGEPEEEPTLGYILRTAICKMYIDSANEVKFEDWHNLKFIGKYYFWLVDGDYNIDDITPENEDYLIESQDKTNIEYVFIDYFPELKHIFSILDK